ncbi:MAG: hypothetical protein ABSH08_20150 [Tepidisphaeraceae bacterium]
MKPFAPLTGKFISAVRRRILLMRIAESIAVATAIASAAGLALLPLAWWRGQSALPMASALFLLGLLCGLIRGISRRPTVLQAAVEADRQLDLHELLGTILQLAASPAESAWRESVADFAENQCRLLKLKPSAVIVSRLGLRAWAGVGILGALLLTSAALTARPANVTAASSSALAYVPANSSQPPDAAPTNIYEEPARTAARPPGPGGTDDDSNRAFPHNRPDDSTGGSVPRQNPQSHSSTGISSTPGSGLAVTASPKLSPEWPQTHNVSGDPSHAGRVAAGTGQSDPRASAPGDTNSTIAASASATANPAPWTTPAWPADAAAAENSITAGRVPNADADLVRDYFQRD